jgi:hypothetical protein
MVYVNALHEGQKIEAIILSLPAGRVVEGWLIAYCF